jgi:hypothetical protein
MKAGRGILVGGIMVKEQREIRFNPVLCGNKNPEESTAVDLGRGNIYWGLLKLVIELPDFFYCLMYAALHSFAV